MYKIGLIGAGNMATAIIKGILKAELVQPADMIVSDIDDNKLVSLQRLGVDITKDNKALAESARIIILAIKPVVYEPLLKQLRDIIAPDTIVVSIAAGISIKYIKSFFDRDVKVIRVMPNTPALIGMGMSAIAVPSNIDESTAKEVKTIFAALGKIEMVEEKLMDAVTAVSGSGPAYAFMFIEAIADAGVMEGLPRDKAYTLAAQTLLGSAAMVLETGEHPGKLKDMVSSPAGTTIDAIYALEQGGFRGIVMQAVKACAEKSRYMEK
ncbi:MAG: pyrroline-5-carboxylate reductase [Clostridiales bacterium]|nr:pyrroline-5-carboxylate reductase [Clostridiales bacterium]